MICIIAMVVFSIMAIFSASYRPLAKEAWSCVFRKLTLRKCETGLNERLKAQITGKLMIKRPRTARFVFKHFELLSWTLVILTVASLAYTAYGGYNYYLYGNCYGPEDNAGFCPLAALGGETNSGVLSNYTGPLVYPNISSSPSLGPKDAKVTIIEFGCYMCPYTKKAEPTIKQLLQKYDGRIHFVFRDFPISHHNQSMMHAIAAHCAEEQGKFWEMHDSLFAIQELCKTDDDHKKILIQTAKNIGVDAEKFAECLDSGRYDAALMEDILAGTKAGIMGTPTFFINNRTITGPKPIAAFEKIIDEELAK